MRLLALTLALLLPLTMIADAWAEEQTVTIGPAIAMHGKPKYGPNFTHFDYLDPNARKGGTLRLSAQGTFDSLNPYIIKGVPAASASVFESLMTSAADEPFSEYGLIAETVEVPKDRSWVAFTLRKEARFHDGSPITVADVIFSLDVLKKKGRPFWRFYFHNVVKAEKIGPRKVKFTFLNGKNREMPLILGQFPIFSKAYWKTRDFAKTTLEPPLGSGPYEVAKVDPGRSIVYRRVKDYWGRNLAVNRGRNNYDEIRFVYYRDQTVALEAFKAGAYDLRAENNSKLWATVYTGPPFNKGWIKKAEIRHERPTGMQGFVFNIRRPVFKDPLVREALSYAFDFEWSNKTLFYGQYTRTMSYFSNSELAARGLPSPAELKILEPFRGRIPARVFTTAYAPPKTDGSGNNRANLRTAFRLLKKAGWVVRDLKMVNAKTGAPLRFEILLRSPAFERVVQPFVRNLARLGITVTYRTVDIAQYINRVRDFDFDMIISSFGQSLSPGNEQRDYWGSEKAKIPGSRNVIGVQDPVIDKLVELVISAPDRKSLVIRTRALDRVLLWNFFVIPQWHIRSNRLAWWNKFDRPAITAKYGDGTEGWWIDPAKERALAGKQRATE